MRNHWTILEEMDPELSKRVTEYRTFLVGQNELLDRKYRELINLSMAAIRLQPEVVLAHAKLASQHGASKGEILGACTQVLTMGGFPSFRCAMLALDEFFQTIQK